MGYVFNFKDAIAWQKWINDPQNQFANEMEKRLFIDLFKPARGDSILDIGCGIGTHLLSFLDMGLNVTGLDPSKHALDMAGKKIQHRVDLHRGVAENLPFDDNTFNYAALISTLEYVDSPEAAISEACRVAKDRVFIGVMNRHSVKVCKERVKRLFSDQSVYVHARFFSIWQVKAMIQNIVGKVPVTWRTACYFSDYTGQIRRIIEQSEMVHRCPFGSFAGLVVYLLPRYRTRPLEISYLPGRTDGVPIQLAETKWSKTA